jgi:hypothetical protein
VSASVPRVLLRFDGQLQKSIEVRLGSPLFRQLAGFLAVTTEGGAMVKDCDRSSDSSTRRGDSPVSRTFAGDFNDHHRMAQSPGQVLIAGRLDV